MTQWILWFSLPLASFGSQEGACVTGRVIDPGANPVAGAVVTLLPRWLGASGSVRTAVDSDGGFSLSSLLPGSYWVVVERFGFEPEVQALSLSPAQSWTGDLRVTPLTEFLRLADGRAELPWLLRGTADDPTRFAPSTASRFAGRLGFETLSAEGEAGSSLIGQGARLAIAGAVRDDLGWYFDGRVEDLSAHHESGGESLGSNHVRYGIDFTQATAELEFRGERLQSSREILSAGQPTQFAERRSSYRLDYRASPSSSDLGLSLAYREALRGLGADASNWSERRAVWEGSGDYTHRLSPSHRLRARVAFLTDEGLAPSRESLALSLVPIRSWEVPGADEPGRRWQFAMVPSWEWEVAPTLYLTPSVEFRRSFGTSRGASVRPGILLTLSPDRYSQLRVGANWEWAEGAAGRRAARQMVGLLIALERELHYGLTLRVEARTNGARGFEDAGDLARSDADGLLVIGGAEWRELRLDLLSRGVAGIRGRVGAAFGSSSGGIGALPAMDGLSVANELSVFEGPIEYGTATFGGEVVTTNTDVTIRYRWLHGTTAELEGLEHIDLELAQALPWLMFGGAKLDLQFAMRGFVRRATANAASEDAETTLTSPVFAAGVGVRF